MKDTWNKKMKNQENRNKIVLRWWMK